MSEQESRYEFDNQEKAEGFVQGVDAVEDDHTTVEGPSPEIEGGGVVWAVYVRRFS